jgi:predicted Rossmann fold flavoprotein
MQYQTIIIGGGAAGLIASISAARRKQNVLIIEKNNSLGQKILVSGNGRCNLTNINLSIDKYYGENTRCLHNIFSQFSYNNTIEFFEELGVNLKTEPDGRVFPASDQASTVLEALERELSRLRVKIKLGERVTKLCPNKTGWQVITDKNTYQTKSVILTTGGKSYPQLGTSGDGYDIARKSGHKIIEPRPALVPLELEGNWFREIQGIQVNIEMTIKQHKRLVAQKSGELLFAHFGISGPVVLNLSRVIVDLLSKPDLIILVNFLPNFKNPDDFISLLENQPKKTLLNALIKFMPKKLGLALLKELKINFNKQVSQTAKKEMQLISYEFSKWRLQIKRPRSFKESMVTAGGVAMNEINPKTMESLKTQGLYFAGEILDIDGISGGYNLQFAWSTGYLAGISVS